MNEQIMAILGPVEEPLRTELHDALIAREDHILDELRVQAANYGTLPALTALVVCQLGLGTPPEEDALASLHLRAHEEVAAVQRAIEEGQ